MQEIRFSKMHGAGNDFIVLSAKEFHSVQTKDQVRFLCHRRLGVGSDGIIILSRHPDYDFEMRFINPDGSEGMFCGNGSRCAVSKAYEWGWIGEEGHFLAVDGVHRAIFHDLEDVEVQMVDVVQIDSRMNGYFMNTGAPHYVELVHNLDMEAVDTKGRFIRFHASFNPEGTNANFIEFKKGALYIRTYERGVEKETLACGTGITAAALAYHNQLMSDKTEIDYKVIARGGKVQIKAKCENGQFKNIMMRGPVKEIFQAKVIVPKQPFALLKHLPIIPD